MNLFFYLQTFILNYSFIEILSDHIFFVLCFIKTQPFVKRKPVKTEKNTGKIAFRFRQVLLYNILFCKFLTQSTFNFNFDYSTNKGKGKGHPITGREGPEG
jgi:hypothetical protein